MKPSGDNFQELSLHSMHNVDEIEARQHASKMNAFVHNFSALMLQVAIVLLIVLQPKVPRVVMVK